MGQMGQQPSSLNEEPRRRSAVTPQTAATYDQAPAQRLVAKHAALTYPYRCSFGLATLDIDEGVFCPTLTKTSPLLLDAIKFRPGDRMLDAFAGSGAFGINAALQGGASVVLIDLSPEAVICAKHNAVLNDVGARLEIREGLVSESIQDEDQFDLVVANPPLLPGLPTGPIGAALFDPALAATDGLIRSLARCLAPSGRCYLLTSDIADQYGLDVDAICQDVRLQARIVAVLDAGYECYRVHEIRRVTQPSGPAPRR